MADDRTFSGDLTGDIPEQTGALDGPVKERAPDTLAWQLTGVADDVRKIAADLGVRPYRVYLVHAEWSGEARGYGEAQIISRREIVPVPRVRDIDSATRNLRATGMTEEGDVVVDQISARLTEDDLLGKTPDMRDAVQQRTSRAKVQFWWEIVENRPSNPSPAIRRFSGPVKVPVLTRGGLQWRVTLVKQDLDRGRDGGTVPRNVF